MFVLQGLLSLLLTIFGSFLIILFHAVSLSVEFCKVVEHNE